MISGKNQLAALPQMANYDNIYHDQWQTPTSATDVHFKNWNRYQANLPLSLIAVWLFTGIFKLGPQLVFHI